MPKISFEKLVGIATIIGTALAAWAFLAPSIPSISVTGDSNTTIQGSNNTVVVYSSENPKEIGPLKIQNETHSTGRKNHEVIFSLLLHPFPHTNYLGLTRSLKNAHLRFTEDIKSLKKSP